MPLQSDKRWNADGSGRDLYIIRDPSRIDGARGLRNDGGKSGAALYEEYVASLRRRARKTSPSLDERIHIGVGTVPVWHNIGVPHVRTSPQPNRRSASELGMVRPTPLDDAPAHPRVSTAVPGRRVRAERPLPEWARPSTVADGIRPDKLPPPEQKHSARQPQAKHMPPAAASSAAPPPPLPDLGRAPAIADGRSGGADLSLVFGEVAAVNRPHALAEVQSLVISDDKMEKFLRQALHGATVYSSSYVRHESKECLLP